MTENAYKMLSTVPLAYKFNFLNKAITNDDLSIPGYIYEETCKITSKSENECNDMLDFLLFSLKQGACKEKLKTLKVMRYLVSNGDRNFRPMLRKKDRLIKEATGANGPSDPIHGNSLYAAIRNEAKELLHLLFEDFTDTTPSDTNEEKDFQVSGMGSQAHKGKYEGFGNAPITATKTIVDKVVGTLTDMVDKMLSTQDEDAEAIANALEADSGGYHAVQVQSTPPASSEMHPALLQEHLKPKRANTIQRSHHTPGRAGGGWEEEDDVLVDTTQSALSTESVAISNFQSESEVLEEDHYAAEEQFIEEIVCSDKPLTSWQDIDNICRMCAALNCDHILGLFHKRLLLDNDLHKMQILTVLETLLYQDIVQLENTFLTFHECLQKMLITDSKPLQYKSKKLCLILEKLLLQNEQMEVRPSPAL